MQRVDLSVCVKLREAVATAGRAQTFAVPLPFLTPEEEAPSCGAKLTTVQLVKTAAR